MPKILLFSDIHLHAFPQFAKEEIGGINSRLFDGLSILDQIATFVEHNSDIKEVLFGGDLFHVRNNISIPTYNAVLDHLIKFNSRLLECNCYFTLITGNHDQSNRTGTSNSLEILKHIKHYGNIRYFDEPAIDTLQFNSDISFVAIPYSENKSITKRYLSTPCHIKLAHVGITGSEIGADFVYHNANDYCVGDLALASTTACFLGHFHKHQRLADNCFYIGAPLHHNLGDEGQKRGFMTYDLSTNEFCHHRTNYPEFLALSDETLEFMGDGGRVKGAYVKVKTKHPRKTKKLLEQYQPKSYLIVEEAIKAPTKAKSTKPAYMGIKEALPAYVDGLNTNLDKNRLLNTCWEYCAHDK
jgi:DNA repair exonuclease SbcCD nuclease subunit